MPIDYTRILKQLEENDPSLKKLFFSGKACNNTLVEWLAKVLKTHHAIETLTLIDADIDYPSFEKLMQSIETHPGIKSLSIINTPLSCMSIVELSSVLEMNHHITSLSLVKTSVCAEGAGYLAGMLTRNKGLLSFNLNENPIGEKGVLAIAAGIQRNTTLQELSIITTRITKIGLNALVNALTINRTMQRLLVDELSHTPGTPQYNDWVEAKMTQKNESARLKFLTSHTLRHRKKGFFEHMEQPAIVKLGTMNVRTFKPGK